MALDPVNTALTAALTATSLISRNRNASIGDLTIDAAVSESHGIKAKATRHPVEDGSDITDHVRLEPLELTIEGVMTDTPAESAAQIAIEGDFLRGGRASDAFQLLRDLVETKEPLTIVTTLRTYPNMVLEEVSVPRDAARGNAIHFTARAVQITVVSSKAIVADPAELRGNPTKEVGKAPVKTVAPSEPTSFIAKGLQAGGIL